MAKTPNKVTAALLVAVVLVLMLVSAAWITLGNRRLKTLYNAWYDRRTGAPIMVSTVTAQNGDMEQVVFATGIGESKESITKESQAASGRISVLPYEVGDYVEKSALVLRVDSPETVNALEDAKLNVDLLKTKVEKYQLEFTTAQDQFARNLIPKNELDVADFTLRETKIELSQAQSTLATAEENVKNLGVYSPISGVLLDRPVKLHESVYLKKVLFTIGSVDPVVIRAAVAEENLPYVRVGQEARITADVYPGQEFTGKVTHVESDVDPKARTFSALVEVPNPQRKLTPGLTVNVYIHNKKNALHVPSQALINPHGEASLFVVEKNVARLRPVTVGVVGSGMTEIVSGLKPHEEVVVFGQFALEDGYKVRVENDQR